jgi:hypothetical protein
MPACFAGGTLPATCMRPACLPGIGARCPQLFTRFIERRQPQYRMLRRSIDATGAEIKTEGRRKAERTAERKSGSLPAEYLQNTHRITHRSGDQVCGQVLLRNTRCLIRMGFLRMVRKQAIKQAAKQQTRPFLPGVLHTPHHPHHSFVHCTDSCLAPAGPGFFGRLSSSTPS